MVVGRTCCKERISLLMAISVIYRIAGLSSINDDQ